MVAPVWTSIAPSARIGPSAVNGECPAVVDGQYGGIGNPGRRIKDIPHKEGIGCSIDAAADDDGFDLREPKKAASPEPGGPFGPPVSENGDQLAGVDQRLSPVAPVQV